MKKILSSILILCSCVSLSQNEKALERSRKLFETAKAKPLYVVLDVEDEKHVQKLTKKEKTQELANYKKLIASYNASIKNAVTNFLTIFPSVKYITSAEAKEFKKQELKTINILMRTFPMKTGFGTTGFNSVTGSAKTGAVLMESRLEGLQMDTNNVSEYSMIQFRTYADDEMMPLFTQSTSKLFCTSGEVCFAVRQLHRTFEDALAKKTREDLNAAAQKIIDGLKTRTLVINKNNLISGLTESDIKTVYPHKFKIVEAKEFEEELMKKNPEILILIPIPYSALGPYMSFGNTHTIYDSVNEEIYVPHLKKCSGTIEKKHFEYYLSPQK